MTRSRPSASGVFQGFGIRIRSMLRAGQIGAGRGGWRVGDRCLLGLARPRYTEGIGTADAASYRPALNADSAGGRLPAFRCPLPGPPRRKVRTMLDPNDHVALWQAAEDVLTAAKALRIAISNLHGEQEDAWPEGRLFSDEEGKPYIDEILKAASTLETISKEPRFSGIYAGKPPGPETMLSALCEDLTYEMFELLDYAQELVTRIGLGRINTPDHPIWADRSNVHVRVDRLKGLTLRLETESPKVAKQTATLARERLRDRERQPLVAYIFAQYGFQAERPILFVNDLSERDLGTLCQLIETKLNEGQPGTYSVWTGAEAKLSSAERINARLHWTELQRLVSAGLDSKSEATGWTPYLDAHFKATPYLEEVRRAASVPTGVAPESEPPAVKSSDAADGMGWPEARAAAEKIRLDGKRFTSYRKMANDIGCNLSVLHDAINNHGTAELQEWASKQRGASRKNATPEVAAAVFESTPQGRETDPSDITEEGDVDEAMDYLIEQAEKSGPEEVARLLDMPADKRRLLAETAYRDPDTSEQIFRRSQRQKKRPRAD